MLELIWYVKHIPNKLRNSHYTIQYSVFLFAHFQVEFDVQLSKDLVPVIYHDLHVSVSLKKKNSSDENDYLELPMNELTLDQLKHMKVYHSAEGKSKQPKFFDEHLDEHQPFPQLADVFDALDHSVGFNVEIKWNMQYHDGTHEMDRINKNPNLYIDCILVRICI